MTIKRFFPLRLVAVLWVALAVWLAAPGAAHAEPIAVQRASLQADNSGWSLEARFDFELKTQSIKAVRFTSRPISN